MLPEGAIPFWRNESISPGSALGGCFTTAIQPAIFRRPLAHLDPLHFDEPQDMGN